MEHPIISRKTYLLIYAALLALLGATLAVAYIPLAGLNTLLAVVVASIKAVLVILYFMHVRHSSTLTRLFVIAGFVWLFILIGLTFSDYLTRTGLFFLLPVE
jgi:cytochrome c oxidase subunit IV